MPRKVPKPDCRPLQIDDFPDGLRRRLAIVAARDGTPAREIIVDAVEAAVSEREAADEGRPSVPYMTTITNQVPRS